jgi:hypothetical protein
MSELQTLLDKAARAKSQGIVLNKPKADAAHPPQPPTKRESNPNTKKKYLIVAAVALIILAGIATYIIVHSSGSDDVTSLVAAVGNQIALPTDEVPTVATVTNPQMLAGQAFFKDAKVGDRVLIYSKAGKAILYRPSEKKVIAVGPLITGK